MPTDAELTFADHTGRFYARRYGFPPMVGRLLGYLSVCDPPDPTHRRACRCAAGEPQRDRRCASRTSRRPAAAAPLARGGRADGSRAARYAAPQRDRYGHRRVLRSWASWRARVWRCWRTRRPERRAVLLEMAAFADFLVEQMPLLQRAVGGSGAPSWSPPASCRSDRRTGRSAMSDGRAGDRRQRAAQVLWRDDGARRRRPQRRRGHGLRAARAQRRRQDDDRADPLDPDRGRRRRRCESPATTCAATPTACALRSA